MKTVAIIQARLTSTRFPRKVLAKIKGKTMLQWVIDAVNEAKEVDQVIVAIPNGQKIPFKNAEKFEGKEFDVLDRYYRCARQYKADIIVRITSDCPLTNSRNIDSAINYFKRHKFPYVKSSAIDGLDVEVFSYLMLQQTWENSSLPDDKEHVTPYMQRVTKLSVDTKEDLERVKKWIDGKGL